MSHIPMNPEVEIKECIAKAFESEFSETVKASELSLQPTKKEFTGTFTFVTFPYGRISKKSPEETAKTIGAFLEANSSIVSGFNVVKGFLNIELNDSIWVDLLTTILSDDQFGVLAQQGEKIMVEYSSPNTNKPLHLGHLRNNFLGYSLSEILKANGHQVTKANLINDRGIHICKSMIAYERFGNNESPESAGKKGDHLVGDYYVAFDKAYKEEIEALVSEGAEEESAKKEASILKEAQSMLQKWENGDADVRALWQKMNSWVYDGFEDTYKLIGVDFDKYYYESDTYILGKDLVEEGLEKGVFFKKEDGSVWCDLSDEGMDEKLVLRGDGTSVYITQDMGTADLKYKDFELDRSIYVVGNEQDYHFQVLKLILKKLGRPYADGIYHMSYGMVDLPTGKMKSREGTVVDADDLIQEMIDTAKSRTEELGKIDGFTEAQANELYRQLALGAIKYYLLKVDPKKRMLFNPAESVDFQGDTGVFIQFTHARLSAIVRKAEEDNIDFKALSSDVSLNNYEVELLELLNMYPKKIKESGDNYSPSIIAQYSYDVAKAYSRFYTECPIFTDPDKDVVRTRVAISKATGVVIKNSLALLGIEAPQRM